MTINPTMKGEATITVRDKDTLDIKRQYTCDNVITLSGYTNALLEEDINIQSGINTIAYIRSIYNSPFIMIPDLPVAHVLPSTAGENVKSDSIVQDWIYIPGTPNVLEKVARFDPPPTQRTINTIYTGGSNIFGLKHIMASYVSLSPPCIQETTEVLDITYRIQAFTNSTLSAGSLPVAIDGGQGIIDKFASISVIPTGGGVFAYPESGFGLWTDILPTNQYFTTIQNFTGSLEITGVVVKNNKYMKRVYPVSLTGTQNIGQIIRTVAYGGVDNDFIEDNLRAIAWAPIVPPTFTNKPIQPIHNHNKNAIEWGNDVNFLSTSQGVITVDGSSWTNDDYPEFCRIDHTATGAVGVSRYHCRIRNTTGFKDVGYKTRDDTHTPFAWVATNRTHKTLPDSHGMGGLHLLKLIKFSNHSVVYWDDDGITIVNQNNGVNATFDITTTPSLPVSSINDIVVDASDNIWIADSAVGLYKLSDPYGTPTVTKMTVATNGLPVGGENNCHAVSLGFNDSLWVLCTNGLAQTLNPTIATPTFSVFDPGTGTPFDYTGITDSNWSNVKYMVVDTQSPTNDMAFIVPINGDDQLIVWWSTLGVSVQGPSTTHTQGSLTFHGVRVSDTGSVFLTYNSANRATAHLTFGTADVPRQLGSLVNNSILTAPSFIYDYYNVPYAHTVINDGIGGEFAITSIADKQVDNFDWDMSIFNGKSSGSNLVNFNNGMVMMRRTNNTSPLNGKDPTAIRSITPEHILDALNGQHSIFEEQCWRKYHWNGAAWELNFYAPAIDTGTFVGGPYPGIRHNFDTESNVFTGRSMIDISAAFATGNFASVAIATFAFKLIPEAKDATVSDIVPSRQEGPRMILDVSTPTQIFKIEWDNAIGGDIIITDNNSSQIIQSTPLDSATYRLIVTISGMTVLVYLDDVEIGNLLLNGGTLDWSNTGGDLVAYVGSQVYSEYVPQRNQPHPYNFYRGVMENIQVWNVAWDFTDVNLDFTDIDGVTPLLGSADLIARYQLTQSLVGTETKLTHGTSDTLINGLNISFADGASGDSFVATDYHTFGVVDGIFKDNATSFTQQHQLYFMPTDTEFSELLNSSGTTLIENVVASGVTEKAAFVKLFNEFNPLNLNAGSSFQMPGMFAANFIQTSHTAFTGALTAQHISGNGYFEAASISPRSAIIVGLTSTPGTANTELLIDFGIKLKGDGMVDIVEAGVIVSADITSWTITDKFRVTRTGTTITYDKVVLGVPTLLFTSGGTSSGTVYGRISSTNTGPGVNDAHGCYDAVINFDRPAYVMTVGNSSTLTGVFHPNYKIIDIDLTEPLVINIAGTPAAVTTTEEYFDAMPVPGPGEVVIHGSTGWMIFNSADVGLAVTGSVPVIFWRE
jgi:hypothetical protein